jgi:Cu+-exporting ATPase
MGNRDLLELAGSVERGSLHPLAKAIVDRALATGANLEEPKALETFEGKGVAAIVGGARVLVGNRALMEAEGVDTAPVAEAASRLEAEAKTVVLVARDGRAAGAIAIADSVRPSSKEAIAQLRRMGLKVAMITGDNRKTAEAIASQIGIDRVLAQVLPKDKAKEVRRLQEEGEVVAFVGDGINDAPALAQSDVGIAIGGGTDIAVESGDIVLMKDDPVDAVAAVQLSRKVMRRIKENLFWAFAYNTALVPLAAGLFYPLFGITFRPELAGLAMALSSVTVVSLSLMLKGYVPPSKMELKR